MTRRTLAVTAGLVAGWPLLGAVLPDGAPLGVVLTGVVLGTATGLLAIGLVLVYRTNRIVNFAYGSLGGVAGIVAVNLYREWGWNYFAAMAAGVVTGMVVGGAVELLVIRRFARSSRLVLTVATIGLAQVLGGLELFIPGWFGGRGGVLGGLPTPVDDVRLHVDPVILNGNHLLIVAVVPFVLAGLAWFLGRTDAGIAMRAAAENVDRARLLGVPVARLSTLVWIVAGGLSALTFVLRAPFQGTVPGGLAGPALLLPALAAAVLARMESLPVAFAAGAALGVIEQLVLWNGDAPSAADVVFLVVILLGLLLRRDRAGRGAEESSSWSDVAVARPVPTELRHLPEVRFARRALLAAGAAAAVAAPFVAGPSTTTLFALALVWGIVGVSLVVLTGWGGHISLGQFAIVGTGAVTAGNLVARDVDLFVSLVFAGLAGAATALLVGLPALRIRGPFLAVTTLAFAIALDSYFLNPTYFDALIPQNLARPVLWDRFPLEAARAMYFLCLAFLALAVAAAAGVRRARAGRVLLAARDNRRAAEAAAVPTTAVILSGFVFSGVLAGVAGGLHVLVLHGARVGSYQPVQSLEVFSMAVIGGLGSVGGVLLGVFSLRALEQVAASYRLLVTGAGLLVVLLVLPGGLGGAVTAVRDRYLVLVARRRGLLVPSLVADRRSPAGGGDGGDGDRPPDEADLLAGALGSR